jgi:hypothetical protein
MRNDFERDTMLPENYKRERAKCVSSPKHYFLWKMIFNLPLLMPFLH